MSVEKESSTSWADYIALEDLYTAYRKAKAECFFDNVVPTAFKFSEYEKNITRNLNKLYKKLTATNAQWATDLNFIGSYGYIPKSFDTSAWDQINNSAHYRATDPIKDWKVRFSESKSKKVKANYRLVIDAEVDFHIVSALWILKVGHLFEEKLDKDLSYGNRLRRYAESPFSEPGEVGELNINSAGLFQPYYSAYQAWRQNGLSKMRTSVENGESIYAITMDITSFYHNADPSFILNSSFLTSINIELSENDLVFTDLLLSAISCWYKSTPDFVKRKEGAIPVGLSASKILSNILLERLDNEMGLTLKPVYYGRYVDDIFLVIKQPEDCNSANSVIRHLINEIGCLESEGEGTDLKLSFDYAPNSSLSFKPEKQKIFQLDSQHGLDLIDQIENQIKKQSSEYRLLPNLPDSSSEMAKKALLASPDAKLEADALRKADGVSIKRLGFSLLFKDINSYAQDLNPKSWSSIRNEFYGLVERHLLNPSGLFDFNSFLPRILSLLVSCGDFENADRFLTKLLETLKIIKSTTSATVKNGHSLFIKQLQNALKQSVFQASSVKQFNKWDELSTVIQKIGALHGRQRKYKPSELQELAKSFLLADLGVRSYKDYWYYEQKSNGRIVVKLPAEVKKTLRLNELSKFQRRSNLKVPYWKAMAFPTRPLSIQEIVVICPDVLRDYKLFRLAIMAIRGAGTPAYKNVGFINKKHVDVEHLFALTPPRNQPKIRIALTNIETTKLQWEKAAKGSPDRTLHRYQNLNNLLNEILKDKGKPHYVVFPELSIPRKWAFSMALKLARNSISMIAGLEYYAHISDKSKLHNDSMVSLVTRWPGYLSNVVLFQPKLKPSHGERKGLNVLGKEQVEPKGGVTNFPIFAHGEFCFGILICSDLTNMNNRLHFQGNVDGLFVLEWNRDVKTFSFLVESAAHDVHTNVIQVNNRAYGDSRIRSPKEKDYERDNVRVKGGVSDYYVIGEIEFDKLRQFQTEHLATDGDIKNSELNKTYKPLPIDFKMSSIRKAASTK